MTSPQEATPFGTDTPTKTLSATSIGALRLWLQTQPVERLIILLKEQWFTLTDDGDGGSLKSRDALEEIIRTCIDEFYASAGNVSGSLTSKENAHRPSR